MCEGDRFLDIDSGRDDEYLSAPTQHYTFIFNVLVMMTLFNEINARKIDGSTNVFAGLHRSRMFIIIWTASFILQVIVYLHAVFGQTTLAAPRYQRNTTVLIRSLELGNVSK